MSDPRINGQHRKALHEALCAAVLPGGDLERLVVFGLNESFHRVVNDRGNHGDRVSDLIDWAQSRNRLDELVQAARAENPTNRELCRFAQLWQGLDRTSLAPLAPTRGSSRPPAMAVEGSAKGSRARRLLGGWPIALLAVLALCLSGVASFRRHVDWSAGDDRVQAERTSMQGVAQSPPAIATRRDGPYEATTRWEITVAIPLSRPTLRGPSAQEIERPSSVIVSVTINRHERGSRLSP